MICFALIIPTILCLVYKIKFDSVSYKEFAIALIASVILIGISIGLYTLNIGHDAMIKSGWVIGKQYIPKHTELRVTTYPDSKGNLHTRTYTVTIPDDYSLFLSTYKNNNIKKTVASYGGELIGSGSGICLDCTVLKYKNTTIGEPAVWKEMFLNPLKFSNSNLYKIIDNKEYSLPPKPKIFDYFDINRVTLLNELKLPKDIRTEVNNINSILNSLDINIGFIFTTYSDNYAEFLKNRWRGGNPNDFVIIVHCNKEGRILNVSVIAWENEYLKILLKDNILNKVKELKQVDDILFIAKETIMKIGFKPKNIKDFNYIKIELPWKFTIFTCIFVLLSSLGILEYFRREDIV